MADRPRVCERDRDRYRHSHRDQDKDRYSERNRDCKRYQDDRDRDFYRDRDRGRRKRSRSRTPDRKRSHYTRSRIRSSSPDDYHRHLRHHRRTPSPGIPQRKYDGENEKCSHRASAALKLDGNGKEKQIKPNERGGIEGGNEDLTGEEGNCNILIGETDEIELMKQLGIHVGFESTKGKLVTRNDVGAVKKVSRRQFRQYMNRPGGFNRLLPAEVNRR